MGRSPSSHQFRFLQNEVAELEKLLKKSKGWPSRKDVRKLVAKFSKANKERNIQDKQVQHWFWNKRYAMKKQAGQAVQAGKTKVKVEGSEPIKAEVNLQASSDQKDRNKLEFEAKSSRDNAWYDVKSFLAHRMLESGDPEVRVRFVGFGPDEDEWVNVRSGVRERSLPCEASECVSVIPGDLILCFKEGNEQALYYDAHVIEVDRRRHDIRGCRCRFLVQYDHDGSTDIVPLRKVCRRPETEYRHPPKLSLENASTTCTEVLLNQQLGNTSITTPENNPVGITPSTAIPDKLLVSELSIAGTEQPVAITSLAAAAPDQPGGNVSSAVTGRPTILPEKQYIDLTEDE